MEEIEKEIEKIISNDFQLILLENSFDRVLNKKYALVSIKRNSDNYIKEFVQAETVNCKNPLKFIFKILDSEIKKNGSLHKMFDETKNY